MHHEQVRTAVIDDESVPWIPFVPHWDQVQIKVLKLDPVRGEMILWMRAPAGTPLPPHRPSGRVVVYTLAGRWRCAEHDWIAGPGSLVYETAASPLTPQLVDAGAEVVTLNVISGELAFLDPQGQVLAIENWRSMLDRYLLYCQHAGVVPRDITAFC